MASYALFSDSQSRQFVRVNELALGRAWQLVLSPGQGPLSIDLDSTICETFGKQKQGAERTYAKVRGHQPLLTTSLETGDVLHQRHTISQADLRALGAGIPVCARRSRSH